MSGMRSAPWDSETDRGDDIEGKDNNSAGAKNGVHAWTDDDTINLFNVFSRMVAYFMSDRLANSDT